MAAFPPDIPTIPTLSIGSNIPNEVDQEIRQTSTAFILPVTETIGDEEVVEYAFKPKLIRKVMRKSKANIPQFRKSNKVHHEQIWSTCIGTQIDIARILQDAASQRLPPSVLVLEAVDPQILLCRTFDQHKICFVFQFGCLVGWDLTFAQRTKLVQVLQPYAIGYYDLNPEEDDMEYTYGDKLSIKHNTITLESDHILEKLSHSYALAQSVKLATYEAMVDKAIQKTKHIPEEVARTGKVKGKRKEISQNIGELFVNRFYVNLHTDILDNPDIFWDHDAYEEHYNQCRLFLEIPQRVNVLNQRLDIMKDLYNMLNDELALHNSAMLEWIVIILIFTEILIEVGWNILLHGILKWV